MKCWLEFVHTPTLDAQGTLCYLHFDERRYLIGNLSEGTSRVILQQNVGLRKATDVLLTGRTEWASLGGIIGTVLNLGEMKKHAAETSKAARTLNGKTSATSQAEPQLLPLRFHGPPNLNYLLATTRRFVFRQGLPLDAIEHKATQVTDLSQPTWSDECIKVWALPVLPHRVQHDVMTADKPDASSIDNKEQTPDVLARDIVNKMFNSDWKFDKLVKTRLPDVQMPAMPFIRDPETKQFKLYSGPRPGGLEPVPDIEVWVREPWPAAMIGKLPPTQPSQEALSYIIKTHSQRGKFLPEKAKELKVKKGADYGLLSRGYPVTNVDGEEVKPEMVLGPPVLGTGFAFLDIPSERYVESILSRPEWKNEEVMQGIVAMVWTLAPGLADDPRIKEFQQKLSEVQHLISASDKSPDDFVLEAAIKQNLRNHSLAPESFPLIQLDPTKGIIAPSFEVPGSLAGKHKSYDMPVKDQDVSPGDKLVQRGLRLVLSPKIGLELDALKPPYDAKAMRQEVYVDTQRLNLSRQSERAVIDPEAQAQWNQAVPWSQIEILTLGTGSSHPGTYRNVSGTLVRCPGDGSYLLDAGEGTLGSLQRMFSRNELNDVLKDLRMIWISHLHADHHLGITSVIKAWYRANYASDSPAETEELGPRLCVVSDVHMLDWLNEYSNVEDFGFAHINCVATVSSQLGKLSLYSGKVKREADLIATEPPSSDSTGLHDPSRLLGPDIRDLMRVRYFNSVFVNHCHGAQAVCFTTRSGFKVSYSGDCRPNFAFADIGKGSHVLIHEATFEEDMRDEALAKKHSTAGEALLVGSRMQAKAVVLTHFSQRYPKMPSLNVAAGDASELAIDTSPSTAPKTMSAEGPAAPSEKLSNDREPLSLDEKMPVPASPSSHPLTHARSRSRDRGNSNSDASHSPTTEYNRLILPTQSLGPLLTGNPQMRVVTAFDYMRLSLGNVPLLEAQQPAMRVYYDALAAEVETIKEFGTETMLGKPKMSRIERRHNEQHRQSRPGEKPAKAEKRRQNRRSHSQQRIEQQRNAAAQDRGVSDAEAGSRQKTGEQAERHGKKARTDAGESTG